MAAPIKISGIYLRTKLFFYIASHVSSMTLADDLIKKGVLKSPHIIQAFRDIKRADFMPDDERQFAEIDEAFPIGEGQTISQPYTVAFMLELLQPKPGQRILDVGFGSGWQSALLAHIVTSNKKMAGRVFAIERIENLCEFGKKNIAKYDFFSSGVVEPYCRDAITELSDIAGAVGGFDGIVAAAAAQGTALDAEKSIPHAWKKYLKTGGKIVMPIDNSLWVFIKRKDGSFGKKEYPGFVFVPLISLRRKNKKQTRDFSYKQFILKPSFFILIAAAGMLGAGALYFLFLVSPPANMSFPKEITITRESSAREAAELLTREGVVRSPRLMLFSLLLRGDLRNIQAGTYLFEKPAWLFRIISDVTNSATRKILTVRIPEGSSLRGIASSYESAGLFSAEEFWAVTGVPASDYRGTEKKIPNFGEFTKQFSFLKERPPYATLEGFLLPDTYELFDTVLPEDAVYKMLQNFQIRMEKEGLFEEIKKQHVSLYEVLILASLLEREAIHHEDKRIIAGIIRNRIRRDMPLQIDASLMYVTGRGSSLLTREDLESDSPYNTYKQKGLPLGPITNPGVDSIRAALNPESSRYLYYLSDRQFTIHYSATFEEHKEKKMKYLQ